MAQTSKIDLVGIGWPVCLLECKRTLNDLTAGDLLEVCMQDPEAVDALVTIVDRSGDEILHVQREGDSFRIQIQKG